jgi:hypothetical protein
VAAYLVANVFMHLGNRYFSFRLGHDGFLVAYARYLLVGYLAAIAAGLLALLVEPLGVEPRLGQLLVLAPLALALFECVSFRLT